ncbi:hypothetical protein pb186bvf_015019 [Paramecium bursaria]
MTLLKGQIFQRSYGINVLIQAYNYQAFYVASIVMEIIKLNISFEFWVLEQNQNQNIVNLLSVIKNQIKKEYITTQNNFLIYSIKIKNKSCRLKILL